jgi:hypothetical protein
MNLFGQLVVILGPVISPLQGLYDTPRLRNAGRHTTVGVELDVRK